MTNSKKQFDVEKLTRRKNKHCGYRFCPWCGATLELRKHDGRERMVCPDTECGFIFYQNPIPAAGGVIVQDDRILLVKRASPPKIGWWCFPAGFMEWGEHPRDTAIREVKEETGLDIKLGPFFEMYSGDDDPRTKAILILFLADIIGGTMQPADDALEVKFFGFDELPEMIAFESHLQALADYNERFRHNKS